MLDDKHDEAIGADAEDGVSSDEDDDCWMQYHVVDTGKRRARRWREAIKQAPVVIHGVELLRPRWDRGLTNKPHEANE